jgi:hypothetical protein
VSVICRAYFGKFCTPEQYRKRVREIQAEQQELGHQVAESEVIYQHLVSYFEKFRENYFMRDLLPENAG